MNFASTRTPEGWPNQCPICKAEVVIEVSQPLGDAPCPACGSLLWFVQQPSELLFFKPDSSPSLKRRLLHLAAKLQGRSRREELFGSAFIKDLEHDSLDLVELVMELEEGIPPCEQP